MKQLVALFAPLCADRSTLDELSSLLDDHKRWPDGHDIFDRIRHKTLAADNRQDGALSIQFLFEEVCAKTLYNLSGARAPFDPDCPYWIVPNAFALARTLGVDSAKVVEIVAA